MIHHQVNTQDDVTIHVVETGNPLLLEALLPCRLELCIRFSTGAGEIVSFVRSRFHSPMSQAAHGKSQINFGNAERHRRCARLCRPPICQT